MKVTAPDRRGATKASLFHGRASEIAPGENSQAVPTITRMTIRQDAEAVRKEVVPGAGFEPATRGFSIRCSTN